MTDVVICGAGPAGTMAAVILARAGVARPVARSRAVPARKALWRYAQPRRARGARPSRPARGRRGAPSPSPAWSSPTRTGVRVEGAYGDAITGRSLPRTVLDLALLRAAAAAGAAIDEGQLVRAPRRQGGRVTGVLVAGRNGADLPLEATLTIAADGASSRLARALSLAHHARRPRRWAAGAYFDDVAGMSGYGEMHVRPQAATSASPRCPMDWPTPVSSPRTVRPRPGPRRCWKTRSAATRCSLAGSREPGG